MDPSAELREVPDNVAPGSFSAAEVEAIMRRRGWLEAPVVGNVGLQGAPESSEPYSGYAAWLAEAAQLLGAQCSDLASLERMLECIFHYDASELIACRKNHAVLSREGARDVLRELAVRVLETKAIDSDRFKEIVTALKEKTGRRGQELFHPVRLALAGCAGEGAYDRIILLIDGAARRPWAVPVKSCRQRILEFCGALD